jgi:hypothetical protein
MSRRSQWARLLRLEAAPSSRADVDAAVSEMIALCLEDPEAAAEVIRRSKAKPGSREAQVDAELLTLLETA